MKKQKIAYINLFKIAKEKGLYVITRIQNPEITQKQLSVPQLWCHSQGRQQSPSSHRSATHSPHAAQATGRQKGGRRTKPDS